MALSTETKKVILRVDLEDKATKGIQNLAKNINKRAIPNGLNVVKIAALGAAAAIGGTVLSIETLGKRAGTMEALASGFKRNFKDMGKSLEILRKGAVGTVSDFDLMQTANRAALLGVTSDIDKLSKLMTTARLRGREMGLDMTQAFEDIVTGIGRGSPLILDNLGIKIPDALKKSMKNMDEAEKTQALLNFAIEDGAKIAKEYGDVQLTTAEKVEVMNAAFVNMRDRFAGAIAPIMGFIAQGLTPLADALGWASDKLGQFIGGLGIDFDERVQSAKNFIHDWWQENEENFRPSIEKLTEKLTGEKSLRTAIIDLFYPTDEGKKKMKELLSQGLQGIIDALVGSKDNPGLIDNFKTLIQTMGSIDWVSVEEGFKTIGKAAGAVLDIIEAMIEAYEGYAILFGSDSYIIPGTNVTKGEALGLNPSGRYQTGVSTNPKQRGSGGGSFATGGSVLSGRYYLAGENGPELIKSQGDHVYNGNETSKMGGGDLVINVNAPVYGVDNLKASIISAVKEAQSRENSLSKYNLAI